MAKTSQATSAGDQSLEQLQKRYQDLHEKKIKADANLDNAKKQLDALKKEARANYGTDDVAELKKKLQAMREENEDKRKKYQADLDRIETDLAAVEAKFAATETPPADGEDAS